MVLSGEGTTGLPVSEVYLRLKWRRRSDDGGKQDMMVHIWQGSE